MEQALHDMLKKHSEHFAQHIEKCDVCAHKLPNAKWTGNTEAPSLLIFNCGLGANFITEKKSFKIYISVEAHGEFRNRWLPTWQWIYIQLWQCYQIWITVIMSKERREYGKERGGGAWIILTSLHSFKDKSKWTRISDVSFNVLQMLMLLHHIAET